MAKFQAYQADSGEYRWRLVEGGRVVSVPPGRIRISGFSRQKKKRVEEALDQALAGIARKNGASLKKA